MTTNFSGIARPYAQAAFQHAKEKNELEAWHIFLENAASIVNDSLFGKLLRTHSFSKENLATLFKNVLGSNLDEAKINFLQMLIHNHRIQSLPDISSLFNSLYSAHLKKSTVRVVTAVETNQQFKDKLKKHLSAKLNREVELISEQDPTILGGAIIYVDKKVIDGSLLNKFNRLLEFTLR